MKAQHSHEYAPFPPNGSGADLGSYRRRSSAFAGGQCFYSIFSVAASFPIAARCSFSFLDESCVENVSWGYTYRENALPHCNAGQVLVVLLLRE